MYVEYLRLTDFFYPAAEQDNGFKKKLVQSDVGDFPHSWKESLEIARENTNTWSGGVCLSSKAEVQGCFFSYIEDSWRKLKSVLATETQMRQTTGTGGRAQ